jgi:hypothetical protein
MSDSPNNRPMVAVLVYDDDAPNVKVAKRVYAEKEGLRCVKASTDSKGMVRTAGEIRFVKDQGPEEREISPDFDFKAKYVKPLTKFVWQLSCSMGHLSSAQSSFNKIKAVNVSPDGKLGGKGYIQKITDIRTNLASAIETISSVIDTVHDEVNAEHWKPSREEMPSQDKAEVEEMLQDSEDILSNPEEYDDKEYQEDVLDDINSGDTDPESE